MSSSPFSTHTNMCKAKQAAADQQLPPGQEHAQLQTSRGSMQSSSRSSRSRSSSSVGSPPVTMLLTAARVHTMTGRAQSSKGQDMEKRQHGSETYVKRRKLEYIQLGGACCWAVGVPRALLAAGAAHGSIGTNSTPSGNA